MQIRQEMKSDYPLVYELVKKAFSTAEHCDGNEHELVSALRKSVAFLPELSLIAQVSGEIAGYILYTKVSVGERTALALAPLAVLPQYQRQGVGLALMEEGHRIAKDLNFDYSIVLGNPQYYRKAGYLPASSYGIYAPFAVPDENFMALKLNPAADEFDGAVVVYDPAFQIN